MYRAYSEERYYEAFKRVRNKLRKLNASQVLIGLLMRLQSQQQGDIDALRTQPPWMLFLLLKWTILYGDFSNRETLTDGHLDHLVNLVHAVGNSLPLPNEYPSLFMFMRGMAYQQFWHQTPPGHGRFSRQAILFRGLDPSHRFRRWFKQTTAIELEDWFDLSFMLLVKFLDNQSQYITEDFFQPVRHRNANYDIPTFLKSISKSPSELHKYLSGLEEQRKRDSSEFLEQTPLVRYPLINLGERHYRYTMPVLMRSLEYFVYDTLREHDPQAFMSLFGPMFEKYVAKGLRYLGCAFQGEQDIQSRIGQQKAVDFLVHEEDYNVLIDAKGVEMGHGGMTSRRPEVISGEAKASVIKGIAQATETARALGLCDRERNFLIVVTFKDLYLGTGKDFYDYVVKERVDRALGTDPGSAPIPLEHMYFISIDEFDALMECAKRNNVSVASILRRAVEADKSPQTKCFVLWQHLASQFRDVRFPAYLESEFREIANRAIAAVSGNQAGTTSARSSAKPETL